MLNLTKTNPKVDDPDRAEDLLDEIQAVLRKRGAALIWHETGMSLCLPNDLAGFTWRAIGQAQSITPRGIQWRPIRQRVVPPS